MKTKRAIVAAFAAISFFLSPSCSDEKIEGNLQVTTEERAVNEFHSVAAMGSFEVIVTPGDNYSLQVVAESNLITYIETKVSGSTLEIRTSNNVNIQNKRPMEIHITTPLLRKLTMEGSGNMESGYYESDEFSAELIGSGNITSSVKADFIYALIAGSGQINLQGEGDNGEFLVTGSGSISAFNLATDTCNASIVGSGTMQVNAEKLLNALIEGSGIIHYKNDPTVNSTIFGSGTLVHITN